MMPLSGFNGWPRNAAKGTPRTRQNGAALDAGSNPAFSCDCVGVESVKSTSKPRDAEPFDPEHATQIGEQVQGKDSFQSWEEKFQSNLYALLSLKANFWKEKNGDSN
jgi:hypothetical protein